MSPPVGATIVIPTRDRPSRLEHCLQALSALAHEPGSLEVIVVNDAGAAPLEPILDRAGAGLGLELVSGEGRGPAAARNLGAARASGEVIAFLDDDCEPERDWLTILLRRLDGDGGIGVGGRILNGTAGDRHSAASQAIVDAVYVHYNADPDNARFLTTSNLVVRAAAFRALDGFDESFPLAGGEDRDFCRRWLESGRRLVYEPAAVIRHSHALTLGGFLRQQFGYGRGAWLERRACAARGRGFRVEPALTSGIFGTAMRGAWGRRDPAQAALLLAWQLANAAGFAWQAARSIGSGSRPRAVG